MRCIIRLVLAGVMSSISMTSALAVESPRNVSENQIAILDIPVSNKFDKELSASVSGAMRSEIVKIGKYEVLDRDKMNTLLAGQKCQIAPYSEKCFIEQGRLLNAGKIIQGYAAFYNKLYYLSFQIIDTKTGKVDNIAEGEINENSIVESARKIATTLANNKFYFLQPNPKPDWTNVKEINAVAMNDMESPGRDDWQLPQKLVDRLPIKQGDSVAEIGAGTGYFTELLSKKTGGQGTVYSVDIEKDMVEYLDNRIKKEGLHNIKTILTTPDGPLPLPKESIAVAFLCDVYHGISDRQDALKRLREVLRREGKLVVVDFHKPPGINIPYVPYSAINFGTLDIKPDNPKDGLTIAFLLVFNYLKSHTATAGISYRFRVPREQVIEEASKAGFKLSEEYDFLPYQYFLVFSKI